MSPRAFGVRVTEAEGPGQARPEVCRAKAALRFLTLCPKGRFMVSIACKVIRERLDAKSVIRALPNRDCSVPAVSNAVGQRESCRRQLAA